MVGMGIDIRKGFLKMESDMKVLFPCFALLNSAECRCINIYACLYFFRIIQFVDLACNYVYGRVAFRSLSAVRLSHVVAESFGNGVGRYLRIYEDVLSKKFMEIVYALGLQLVTHLI